MNHQSGRIKFFFFSFPFFSFFFFYPSQQLNSMAWITTAEASPDFQNHVTLKKTQEEVEVKIAGGGLRKWKQLSSMCGSKPRRSPESQWFSLLRCSVPQVETHIRSRVRARERDGEKERQRREKQWDEHVQTLLYKDKMKTNLVDFSSERSNSTVPMTPCSCL